MNESENRPHVTLEDLLHLKRSERPTAEFWPEFDRQLRRKQLAAIVENHPWWRRWPRTKTFSRVYLPLGATAALALAIGSVRSSLRPSRPEINEAAVTADATVAPAAPTLVTVAAVDTGTAENKLSQSVASSQVLAADAGARGTVNPVGDKTLIVEEAKKPMTPSERSIAANLAVVMAAKPAFAKILADESSLVSTESVTEVEPLTQISTPRDSRRARLLAYSVALDPHAPDSSNAVRSRERITRRLSDDALYDSISRLGLTGDRVSIKF